MGNLINIDSNCSDLDVEIYNAKAQLVLKTRYKNELEISHLESGIYYLNIYCNEHFSIKNIVKL